MNRHFLLQRVLCGVSLCWISTFSICSAQDRPGASVPPDLDNYIGKVLKTFEVPGVSVAIVKDGKVLLAKGFGVRELGDPAPVDAHTLFSIASNSKAFTATALAMLVEEGKLKWEDPVIDHLPWFRMSDPYITTHMTIRDLLVHHSGLPAYRGDLMLFPPSSYSRKEILEKLKLIPLVTGFRTTYAYDNILYLAAGEIVAEASGMSWEDFIKTRIFDKLGMSESLSRFSDVKKAANVSASHKRVDNRVQVFNAFSDFAIGDNGDPVGGILTNATDMAKWLLTQLDSGRIAGRTPESIPEPIPARNPGRIPGGIDDKDRLFQSSTTNELWKIVRPMPIVTQPAELKPAQMDFYGYALGFRAYNYGRYKVVGHGGALDGFVSQIAMVPSLGLGISVFTNQESAGAYWSIIYHVLDYYMRNPSFDWIGGYKRRLDTSLKKLAEEHARAIVPDPHAKAFLSPEKYLGVYRDTIYGEATITREASPVGDSNSPTGADSTTVLRFSRLPHLVADLQYFQYDTYIARFRNRFLKADAYLTFSLNPDGSIDQATMKIIDPDSDIVFSDVILWPVPQKPVKID